MASDRDPSRSDAPWCPEAAVRRRATAGWLILGVGLLSQAGCMSALTATTLREALRETAASLSTPHDLDHASLGPKSRRSSEAEEGDDPVAEDATEEVDDVALEKVIDNAVARLSAAGGIDPATQELLIQTLEKTPPQDWAVVVNDFAATLEAAREAEGRQAPAEDRRQAGPDDVRSATSRHPTTGGLIMPVAAPAPIDVTGIVTTPIAAAVVPAVTVAPAPPSVPPLVIEPAAAAPVPETLPAVALVELETAPPRETAAAADPATMPLPPEPESFVEPPKADVALPLPATETVPAGPAINNPCFATRVRGWGQIDRFQGAAFRPGQEVIVYFELDRLRIRADDAGHTTTIDTAFRLLDGAGDKVGQWTFEPIVETCPSPRRDYFARYFIRIPEDAKPGRHRLEWSVTDGIAGATRQAHLDLDVVPTE